MSLTLFILTKIAPCKHTIIIIMNKLNNNSSCRLALNLYSNFLNYHKYIILWSLCLNLDLINVHMMYLGMFIFKDSLGFFQTDLVIRIWVQVF